MGSFKKITSLTLGFSFLTMSFTGIMLYIVPKGKIAYWADWQMFGLSKGDYGDIHTTSMVVFILFGGFHIYYNWKPIVSYMKDTTKKVSFTKKEFLIALFINLFFVIGTLYSFQPMKVVLDVGSDIKNYWTKEYGKPPYNHAEDSSLKKFIKKMDIDIDDAKEELNENGIKYNMTQSLKEIARKNGVSPQKIYEIIE